MLLDLSQLGGSQIDNTQPVQADQPPEQTQASAGLPVSEEALPDSAQVNVNLPEGTDEASILDYGADILKGVVRGGQKAWNASADLVSSGIDFAGDLMDKGWKDSEWRETESRLSFSEEHMPTVKTAVGELVSDVSEFAAGFLMLGKLKLAGNASKLAKYSLEMAKGMAVDTVAFKANTGNLTNTLVETFPQLDGPIADFLKNDGKDDHISGRLKNALEGAGLGLATDGIISMFKMVKAVRKHGNNPEAIAKEIQESVEVPNERVAQEAKEEAVDVGNRQADEVVDDAAAGKAEGNGEAAHEAEGAAREAEEATAEEGLGGAAEAFEEVKPDPVANTRELLDAVHKGRKDWSYLGQQDVLDIVQAIHEDPTMFDEFVKDIKFKTYLAKNPEAYSMFIQAGDDGLNFMKGMHTFMSEHLDRATKQSFEEVASEARASAQNCGLDGIDAYLKKAAQTKENLKDAILFSYNFRSIQRGLSKATFDVASRINAGTASEADFALFEKLGSYTQNMYKLSRDIKTAEGRLLAGERNTMGFTADAAQDASESLNLFKVFEREADDVAEEGAEAAERSSERTAAMDSAEDMSSSTSSSSSSSSSSSTGERTSAVDGDETFTTSSRVAEEGAAEQTAEEAATSSTSKPRKKREPMSDEEKARRAAERQQRRLELIEAAKKIVACGGDPDRVFLGAKTLGAPTWTQQFNFWFTQQILTGLTTHAFNFGGNVIKSGLMIGERLIGAAARSAYQGDSRELQYALEYAGNIFGNITSASKLALNAMKTDKSGLATNSGLVSRSKFTDTEGNAIMLNSKASFDRMWQVREASGEKVAPWEKVAANMISTLGILGRGNAKVMLGEDEIFRQLHFQASKKEIISRNLDAMGLEKGSKEWKVEFKKQEDAFFDEYGLVNMKNKDAAEAMKVADRSTYSEDINSKGVELLNQFANSSPYAKMALPFVRTVYNVAGDSVQHMPGLNLLSGEYWDALHGRLGEQARQEAMGKMAVGASLSCTAVMLAADGKITGALSSNQKERDAQLRAGMKPYSIRIGDTWVSYQRADPVSACLGAAANFATLVFNKEMTPDETAEYAGQIIGGFMSAIADKSFMTGLHDVLDVVYAGDKAGDKLNRWAGQTLSSMLPGSGLVNQLWRTWLPNGTNGNVGDDYYHETDKSIWAGLKNSGYAGVLNKMGLEAAGTPIKYDWVTGNAVQRSVMFSDDKSNEFVTGELLRESKSVYGAPLRTLKGIPLTPEQYSRYCELHGTIQLGGKTMMEALEKTMKSKAYDYKRERIADDWDAEGNTYRGNMIRAVMKEYRDAATQRLYKEFPDLVEQINERADRMKMQQSAQPVSSKPRPGQTLLNDLGASTLF